MQIFLDLGDRLVDNDLFRNNRISQLGAICSLRVARCVLGQFASHSFTAAHIPSQGGPLSSFVHYHMCM